MQLNFRRSLALLSAGLALSFALGKTPAVQAENLVSLNKMTKVDPATLGASPSGVSMQGITVVQGALLGFSAFCGVSTDASADPVKLNPKVNQVHIEDRDHRGVTFSEIPGGLVVVSYQAGDATGKAYVVGESGDYAVYDCTHGTKTSKRGLAADVNEPLTGCKKEAEAKAEQAKGYLVFILSQYKQVTTNTCGSYVAQSKADILTTGGFTGPNGEEARKLLAQRVNWLREAGIPVLPTK